MSYFSPALKELMERNNLTGATLARLSGVSASTISRVLNDGYTLSIEDLGSIASAISGKATERGELIRAYLLDIVPKEHAGVVDVRVFDAPRIKERLTPYTVKLPADLEEAMTELRSRLMNDRDLREHILSLARLLKKGEV